MSPRHDTEGRLRLWPNPVAQTGWLPRTMIRDRPTASHCLARRRERRHRIRSDDYASLAGVSDERAAAPAA